MAHYKALGHRGQRPASTKKITVPQLLHFFFRPLSRRSTIGVWWWAQEPFHLSSSQGELPNGTTISSATSPFPVMPARVLQMAERRTCIITALAVTFWNNIESRNIYILYCIRHCHSISLEKKINLVGIVWLVSFEQLIMLAVSILKCFQYTHLCSTLPAQNKSINC